MAKHYKHNLFKLIVFFQVLSINFVFIQSSAQISHDVVKYAIINSDIDSFFITDYNNLKTAEFSIKGLSNNDEVEKLKSKFVSFGGVKECNFSKKNENQDVYLINMKFYEKAHFNYFLKMLVTFDINYTMHKGVLKRTEDLRKKSKSDIK